MEQHDSTRIDTPAPAGFGPGQTLSQARTALGLSTEDVAQMLHLSARQVLALEGDEYDRLPEPTYVRGYLRSYAQLLGLTPEEVLASYARLNESRTPVRVTPPAPEGQVTSGDHTVKFATMALVAVVGVLVFAWWQGRGHGPVAVTKPTAAQTVTAPVPLGPPPPEHEFAAVKPAPGTEPASALTGQAAQPVPVPHDLKSPLASFRTEPPGSTPSPAASPTPAAPPQAQRIAAAPTPAAGAAPRHAQLILHARAASWADVRDARNDKLLYETIPAGGVVMVDGPAPFNIFIGNPDAVSLEFNGHKYEASQFKQGLSARFTLGGPAQVSR